MLLRHYIQAASDELPVFPNGNVNYEGKCFCVFQDLGRTNIDGDWIEVCMKCGCLMHYWKNDGC